MSMSTASAPNPKRMPPRPRLVLRLGFAGRKDLTPAAEALLDAALDRVLRAIAAKLVCIKPDAPKDVDKVKQITAFYADEKPLLRLVTGLCEGADARAADALTRLKDGSPNAIPGLDTELAAVLPFDVLTYRESRPENFRSTFDRQLADCAWVLVLDGTHEKPRPDTEIAKKRRARGYRAQGAFLLRHTDILVAAADPSDPGAAGGTLETVREALEFDLPVVFIHTGKANADDAIHLIEPQDFLPNILDSDAPKPADRDRRLAAWVSQLTADPDAALRKDSDDDREHHRFRVALLTEFFHFHLSPECHEKRWFPQVRLKTWEWFEVWFKSGPIPNSDPKLAPFSTYRDRATTLNRFYSGLYRGAFLLNYILAILAVFLATISLALLVRFAHTPLEHGLLSHFEAAICGFHAGMVVSTAPQEWLCPLLVTLGIGKVGILLLIIRNTWAANHKNWNDRAVDTRYLAERLRAMYYLPQAGSHQPPAPAPTQFASRALHQSAIDWLFDAIVRSISPASLAAAHEAEIPSSGGVGSVKIKRLLVPKPLETIIKVRDSWLGEQIKYHHANSQTMHAMHHCIERVQKFLGWVVLFVVGIDLILLGGEHLGWWPHHWTPFLRDLTPALIAVSAILPAVIAAMSGIRFQSECKALAERSATMRVILEGRRPEIPGSGRIVEAARLKDRVKAAAESPAADTNLGSWCHDVLRLTERVATDFVHEAAEWSVLYTKEVNDPG